MRSAAAATSGKVLEMQFLRPHARLLIQKHWGWAQPSDSTRPPGDGCSGLRTTEIKLRKNLVTKFEDSVMY